MGKGSLIVKSEIPSRQPMRQRKPNLTGKRSVLVIKVDMLMKLGERSALKTHYVLYVFVYKLVELSIEGYHDKCI